MGVQSLLDSIPIPSAADMDRHRQFARRYTLVFLRKGPADRDDEPRAEQLHIEHLQHLTKLQMVGKLILNGPTLVAHDTLGVRIYAAKLEEADAMAETDPKVRAGYLTMDAMPWIAAPSDTNSG
jgi:uncharacterized protein YciI